MKTSKIIGLAMVSSSILSTLPLGSGVALAQSSASDAAHALPNLTVQTDNNINEVKPDAPLSITVDTSSPNWARFREQFVKNQFSIVINGVTVQQASFDPSTNTITVDHTTFDRDTPYTGVVSVKATANGNTASGNASESFTFTTGSAVGEAMHVSALVESPSVSVDKGGVLDVTVTDDYGDPATNATVSVIGTGNFQASTGTAISDGLAKVTLIDQKAEDVTLTYTVTDNNYGDKVTGYPVSEEFVPGAPDASKSTVNFPTGIVVAGTAYNVTGTLEDQYGNVIPNQSVTLTFDGQTQTVSPKLDGTFSLSVTPTQATTTATATVSSGSVTLATTSGSVTPAAIQVPLASSLNDIALSNFDRSQGNYFLTLPLAPLSINIGGNNVQFNLIPTSGNDNVYLGSPLSFTLNTSTGYSKLWLLEDGVNGNQSGSVTITYVDGSQQTKSFNAPDWMVPASYTNNMYTAWTGIGYDRYFGNRAAYIFATSVDVDNSKAVKSITFGTKSNIALWGVTLM